MPLHRGHLALVDFSLRHCDRLTILLCVEARESISGDDRERWLRTTYQDHPTVSVRRFNFTDAELPATSASSRTVSAQWTVRLKALAPRTDVIIGSEAYVRYVAEAWGIGYRIFDVDRSVVPISATEIRNHPYRHRAYLAPAARPDFVQRIVLHGTESTGKSTLARHLATVYGTVHVPETAREIVEHTDTVIYDDLLRIADRQAEAIREAIPRADGVLFIDTDVFTTLAYTRYLFDRELPMRKDWLAAATNHLCLFTRSDAPFVQDGTRLEFQKRAKLERFHRAARLESEIPTREIVGINWVERTEKAEAFISAWLKSVQV